MHLYLSGHSFHFECENLCRVFFPYSAVKKVDTPVTNGDLACSAVIIPSNGGYTYMVNLQNGEKRLESKLFANENNEYTLTSMLFKLFSEFTEKSPPWGMLTGIHPVKLLNEHAKVIGFENAVFDFKNKFFVSQNKTELAKNVLNTQKPIINSIKENDFSLYIGIPFCPTRCSYCSFVSQSTEKSHSLIEPYFNLLLEEVKKTGEIASNLELNLRSVYIGGGTPTTLSDIQLDLLCKCVYKNFDMTNCSEFTVEAGRPDTITFEKLAALKSNNVDRISINPQSLSDKVLKAIGRNHSAKDVITAFEIAEKVGFKSINSDLIAGLSEDTLDDFKNTLETVINLGANNITVHCLAIKRAAKLDENSDNMLLHKQAEVVSSMVDFSIEKLTKSNFLPYYLYRQSRMAANLENTGWAKSGSLCDYNIYTMDESMTVLACGAGAVSKIKDPYSNRLERIFNFKYPFEYISRNDEILKRKDGVTELYEQFRKRIH